MTLSKLFSHCVNKTYIRAPYSSDYAYDLMYNHLTIYFQDSDGIVDWIHNIDFPAAAYKREGRAVWYAHRGFLKVWKSLIPRIDLLITDIRIKQITVVGYSHGAALAVFCHEYVWYQRPDLRNTLKGYGFGCPRVIWGSPSTEITERWKEFTVIRNREDIVTHLPPSVLGYRHIGNLLEIGEKGKYSFVDAHRSENLLHELRCYEEDVRRRNQAKMKE